LARPWRLDGDALILSIRLTPRSSTAQLGGIWQDGQGAEWLCASVRAVPEKGRANAALVTLLAKTFGVPSGAISLEAGDTSRLKRVRIARHGVRVAGKLESLAGEA
jgi:uncharacterized protein YggU (UPF0235/DUF167 family)